MTNRRLMGTIFGFIALSAFTSVVVEVRWPHWTATQQSAYQEFFTVFTGMLGFFLVMLGTYAAFQSVEASKRQATAADKQAEAADAQAEAAKKQTSLIEIQTALARKTLQEAIRPVIVLERVEESIPWNDPKQRFNIANVGAGTATDIVMQFYKGPPKTDLGYFDFYKGMRLNKDQKLFVPAGGFEFTEIAVQFQDVMGNPYGTMISKTGDQPVALGVDSRLAPSSKPFIGVATTWNN